MRRERLEFADSSTQLGNLGLAITHHGVEVCVLAGDLFVTRGHLFQKWLEIGHPRPQPRQLIFLLTHHLAMPGLAGSQLGFAHGQHVAQAGDLGVLLRGGGMVEFDLLGYLFVTASQLRRQRLEFEQPAAQLGQFRIALLEPDLPILELHILGRELALGGGRALQRRHEVALLSRHHRLEAGILAAARVQLGAEAGEGSRPCLDLASCRGQFGLVQSGLGQCHREPALQVSQRTFGLLQFAPLRAKVGAQVPRFASKFIDLGPQPAFGLAPGAAA